MILPPKQMIASAAWFLVDIASGILAVSDVCRWLLIKERNPILFIFWERLKPVRSANQKPDYGFG